MQIKEATMDKIGKLLFMPLMLVLNYALFQYLLTVYYKRRRQSRVRQLLSVAFLGFAVLIIFAQDDPDIMRALNNISETCCQLAFLLQITIIGRDVQAKIKVRSIMVFTLMAEVLILIGWLVIIAAFADLVGVTLGEGIQTLFNVSESVTLMFVAIFRFYYLSMSKGVKSLFQTRKVEMLAYFAMVTHEVPWSFAEAETGVSWEYVQGFYMRLLLAWCILLNIKSKAVSSNLSKQKHTTRASTLNGPAIESSFETKLFGRWKVGPNCGPTPVMPVTPSARSGRSDTKNASSFR